MRVIKVIAGIVVTFSATCHAATDPECLKHLGGAFGDVECFNGLSNDLRAANIKLANDVASTIPKNSKNKGLLKEYLRHQVRSRDFCELRRQSMTNWVHETATVNPRYHDYDVVYYECVYFLLDGENRFLKSLYTSAGPQ